MKNIFSVIIFLISIMSFAQELPKITPPSPAAGEITKYGDLPINESTGKASANVPLYTYAAGQLQIPISLNYTGNGVKINDPNTCTGVNWTLNAGGVITRTVYHNPDEDVVERIFQEDIEAFNLVNEQDDAALLRQRFNSTSMTWDTQPDIFNFSFSGMGGSFYLDRDYNPVLITADTALKIEITGPSDSSRTNLIQSKTFKITTPDGVAYHFGGNEVEVSQMEYGFHTNTSPRANTAFYLYKIEHPINGNVFLEYGSSNYRVTVDQMHSAQEYNTNFAQGGSFLPGGGEAMSPTGKSPSDVPALIINKIEIGKFLTKIWSVSNPQEVIFNYDTSIDGGFNFDRILNSVEVKNNTVLLHKIDLTYLVDYDGIYAQRFFLDKVEFNKSFQTTNAGKRQYKVYSFEYNDPLSLPARFSYSQDHFGYFNGAVNTGLLPYSEYTALSHYGQADRGFHFENSLKGVLTKVIYPTGGHTAIDYESHIQKRNTFRNVNFRVSRNNYPIDENGAFLNDVLSNGTQIGANGIALDDNGDPIPAGIVELLEDQFVDLNVILRSVDQVLNQDLTFLKVTNLTEDIVILNQPIAMPIVSDLDPVFIEERTTQVLFEKNKAYKIELILNDNPGATPIVATLQFRYANGVEEVNAGSLRVKRVTDSATDTQTSNIKRYYYTKIEDAYKTPLELASFYVEPIYEYQTSLLVKRESIGLSGLPFNCVIVPMPGLVLNINPNNYSENVINNYQIVSVSYGGDNFERGGIEKRFAKENAAVIQIVNDSRINTPQFSGIKATHKGASWIKLNNGKLYSERIFRKAGDTLYKIQEKGLSYTNNSFEYIQGAVASFFDDCGPGPVTPYENVGLGKYEIRSKEIVLLEQIDVNYIDAVPLTFSQTVDSTPYIFKGWMIEDHDNDGISNYNDQDYLDLIDNHANQVDETNYRKITTTTSYEYNSDYAGQPTKIISNTSDSSETLESVNHYLDEATSIADSTIPEELTHYTSLINAHRVGAPIQTESYIQIDGVSDLLSTQKTVYSNFGANILPEVVMSAKGNSTLEERVIFVDYDFKGNPTELKYKDGSVTKYVYNALNQVIRKVDNFTVIGTQNGTTDCELIGSLYPNALVTSYFYDSITNLVTHIVDPRCNTMYYEYDEFYRLKYVKDRDGNILSKNEYNYTTQN